MSSRMVVIDRVRQAWWGKSSEGPLEGRPVQGPTGQGFGGLDFICFKRHQEFSVPFVLCNDENRQDET